MQLVSDLILEDTMPLNETDKAWIRQEIRIAHERRGWGRLTGFVKDWGGTGAAIAILLFALTKWEAYVEFRTNTNNRLSSIEKTLVDIQGSLAKQNLVNHAALPLADFKATLPDLGSSIAVARKQKIKISSQVVNDLSKQLNATETGASEFWPTAAEFISYRSALTHEDLFKLADSLPRCVDTEPHPATTAAAINKPGLQSFPVNPAHYDNCRIQLDSLEEDVLLSHWAQTVPSVISLVFNHCLVIYKGGVVQLRFNSPIVFQNCLWELVVSETPPISGQEVTEKLLGSNPDSFTLSPAI